jgi:CheY-like chemotaxis protein
MMYGSVHGCSPALRLSPAGDMPHKSILIVDDEALVRRTARSVLCDLVDVCHEAENGQQAVEKVKELKPDLVLLDISMPVMNGLRAVTKFVGSRPLQRSFSIRLTLQATFARQRTR